MRLEDPGRRARKIKRFRTTTKNIEVGEPGEELGE
jgi:hypothetical protein